jgi:hypothetical protein
MLGQESKRKGRTSPTRMIRSFTRIRDVKVKLTLGINGTQMMK